MTSRRKINWNLERSSPHPAKRKCKESSRKLMQQSENILWPETDEDDEALDNLPNGQTLDTQDDLQNPFSDDSIFSNIDLPRTSDGGTPTETGAMLEGNDTIFMDINLANLTFQEQEDIFADADADKEGLLVQNTQTFLEDVSFKVPKLPEQRRMSNVFNTRRCLLEGMVQGTQYETREAIQNRTMHNKTINLAAQEAAILPEINWETQSFLTLADANAFPTKGAFYGLPEKVKKLILEHKGIRNLYEWQDECLNLPAIQQRKNLIYALPTSGGKTLVAEILMLREILCRQKNVLFILPYVSIVQEKVSSMSPFAIALDFIVDEYTAGKGKCPPMQGKKRKSLFVASIEKGAVLMDSLIEAERANEIGLVVVDELHLIGEQGRGATLETLLTKVMFLNANIQIVGMSATIGNLSEISTFLNADVYTRGFRPVELREYIKCGNDILEINSAGKTLEETFIYSRSVNFKYSDAVARVDPDHLAGLVGECAPDNCCLVFCSSRKNCENVALLLCSILPKTKFREHRKKEKADLMDALEKVCGILGPVLAKTIPFGIAYHHSGLTADERKFIEAAYRFGVVSVICCTSTLAAGVNLPAKRVIIRAPYVGREFMTLCKYKQMVGRAGRAGMGEAGESILISSSRDNVRVGEMILSPMDKAVSSLDHANGLGLQSLILSAIGLDLASCRLDLSRLIDSTLLAVQAQQLGIATQERLLCIVREMFRNKVVEICSAKKSDCSDIMTTQEAREDSSNNSTDQVQNRRQLITKSTRFQLTPIGRAAFKAGVDYKRAYAIYSELKRAQGQLILTNYGHLLYLVVAFNSNANGDELCTADPSVLFRVYTTLDETTRMLFQVLGFSEAHAAKLGTTHSIRGPLELKTNRLYKVLILLDTLNVLPIPFIAAKYNIDRGTVQHLISQATSAASALVRLCEQIEEFWCYKPLFERISSKIDRCATLELEPLLDLPAVKINRAKQLFAAGFKTIADIAKCRPMELVKSVEYMPFRTAKEIVSASKIILMKKLDHLEEETIALKLCLQHNTEDSQ